MRSFRFMMGCLKKWPFLSSPYISQHLSTSWDSPDGSPGAPPQHSFKDISKCLSELKDKLEMSLKETWPRILATGKSWKCKKKKESVVDELLHRYPVLFFLITPVCFLTVSYVDFSLPPAPSSREEFLRCMKFTWNIIKSYSSPLQLKIVVILIVLAIFFARCLSPHTGWDLKLSLSPPDMRESQDEAFTRPGFSASGQVH